MRDGKRYRRAVRRAARTRCQAVGLDGFRMLGRRVLDMSPRGLLVACDESVALGEQVVVSFRAPPEPAAAGGEETELWMDAEAEIARIVHGFRPSDPGYCIGLEFKYFERSFRQELLTRLAGCPPPVPQRRMRRCRPRVRELFSVQVRDIIEVRGGSATPRGVFHA